MVRIRASAAVMAAAFATLGLSLAYAQTSQPAASVPGHAGVETAGAAPAPAAAAAGAPAAGGGNHQQGRDLFNNWGCNACHALKDAGAEGHVGPGLDGNPNLTQAFIVERVTNGSGPMPGFGGQMSDVEIGQVAQYIMEVAAK